MNPGNRLLAVADGAAEPEFKRAQHFLERAAVRAQHHAEAEDNGANALLSGLERFLFPLIRQFAEKIMRSEVFFSVCTAVES